MKLHAGTEPKAATMMALSVPTVRSAYFNIQQSTGVTTGVVYCGETDIEYDVRELEHDNGTPKAWNVNDDDGRDFTHTSLPMALQEAISANRETVTT